MNLADCYRLLGLSSGAPLKEIKAAYRRLARQYHPDVNPQDQGAREKFIAITEAYKLLLEVVPPAAGTSQEEASKGDEPKTQVKVNRRQATAKTPTSPPLSESEQLLKWNSYRQLQDMLKSRRFARAIALVEGLSQRFPQDLEIRQWQAIAYASWGRHLVAEGQVDKARSYLKKALRTDPHNRALWAEVDRDFRRLENML